jgi:hypothetical protein
MHACVCALLLSQGLEDQLLGEVVRRERPDLEEARDRLVLSISNDKRQLAELEDKVGALSPKRIWRTAGCYVLCTCHANCSLTPPCSTGATAGAQAAT